MDKANLTPAEGKDLSRVRAINQYLYYMWSHWSVDTCHKFCIANDIQYLESHLWMKWVDACETTGSVTGAPAVFWSLVDENIKLKLVKFCTTHYNKQ